MMRHQALARGAGKVSGRRTGGPGFSVVLILIMLAGCAARLGPEALDPVAERPEGNGSVTVLTVTNRALTTERPQTYRDGRGKLSYEQFTMQMVTSDSAGKPGVSAIRHPENPSKDFVTTGRRELDEALFMQSVNGARKADDTIVVFVHGYNTSYQEAVFRLAQLGTDSDTFDLPILFSWPPTGDFRGYLADRDSTTYARDDLVHLLTLLSRSRSKERISVIGHSMGGWLVMEALRQLRLEGRDDVIARLQVGLASPDIDIDVFRKQAAVVGPLTPPLGVLVSADDRALSLSSRLAGGKPRLGLARADDPLIQEIAHQNGLQILDVSNLPATDGMKHDRFVALAAHYSVAAAKDGSVGGLRQAGVYILDATGRILSAPFSGTARILAGSP